MLGNLLKKILPKKREKEPIAGRDLDGRNNVGYPTVQVSREIDEIINKHYRSIRPIVKFYKETLFFKWLPSIINTTLDDDQLKNLSGRNVQMVYLLLFRDMLRHVAIEFTPSYAPDNWQDLLAQEVLDNCRMLSDSDDNDIEIKKQLFANSDRYYIENEEPQAWAIPIAELIHIHAKDLYYWHHSLTNTILKKITKKGKK